MTSGQAESWKGRIDGGPHGDYVDGEVATWPVRLTVGHMILSHVAGVRLSYGLRGRWAESRNKVRFLARRS